MLTKSKIARFTLGSFLAAACLIGGSGLLQPTQADAAVWVYHRPIVRVVTPGPIVTTPIVTAPIVTPAPVVAVGPVYAHPIYHPFAYHYGFWRR